VFFQGKKIVIWPGFLAFSLFLGFSLAFRKPSAPFRPNNLAATQFTVICNLMEDQAAPQKKKSTPKDGQLIRH